MVLNLILSEYKLKYSYIIEKKLNISALNRLQRVFSCFEPTWMADRFATQLFVMQVRAILKKDIQKNVLDGTEWQLALFSQGF
jgi:thiamine biosynthesis lipoprotein ApbE